MNAADDPIAAIAREIGLDAAEIGTRKAFLEFGADDVAVLEWVHALTDADGDAFSEGFYEHRTRGCAIPNACWRSTCPNGAAWNARWSTS